MMYPFTTVPHPHGHWQLQELLGNIYYIQNVITGSRYITIISFDSGILFSGSDLLFYEALDQRIQNMINSTLKTAIAVVGTAALAMIGFC